MGRFSPTVLPNYGPTLGEGLQQAASDYVMMSDRSRNIRRQTEADQRTREQFGQEMQLLAAQTQGAQLHNTETQNTLAVQPLMQAGQLRSLGYERGPDVPGGTMPAPQVGGGPAPASATPLTLNSSPGAYRFNPALAPLTPAQQFQNEMTRVGAQGTIERDVAGIHAGATTQAASTQAQAGLAEARIRAAAETGAATIGANSRLAIWGNGTGHLTALQRENMNINNADQIVQSVGGDAGKAMSYLTSDESADARSAGLNATHVMAALDRYRAKQQAAASGIFKSGMAPSLGAASAMADSLRSGAYAPGSVPSGRPGAGAANAGGGSPAPKSAGQRDAELVGQGMNKAARIKQLTREGYNVVGSTPQ